MDNRLPPKLSNCITFLRKTEMTPRSAYAKRPKKTSFHKLTGKTFDEDTLWKALCKFICVHCEFSGQFWRLVRTKIGLAPLY